MEYVQLPGTGLYVAAKDIAGTKYQVVLPSDDKGNPVNPASDDTLLILTRLLKLLQSLDITDSAGRQRVSVDNAVVNNVTQFGTNNIATGAGIGGNGVPRVTVAIDSLMDEKVAMMREAYNNGIARNLTFN